MTYIRIAFSAGPNRYPEVVQLHYQPANAAKLPPRDLECLPYVASPPGREL